MRWTDVARVAQPSQLAFLRDFQAPQRPVVVTGECDDWESLGRWGPADLRARCADHPVRVVRDGLAMGEGLHGFLDGLIAGDAAHLAPTPLRAVVPEVAHEVRVPQFVARTPLSPHLDDPVLWIGARSALPLHVRPHTEILLTVVSGTVRVRLFGMDQARALYRRAPWSAAFAESPVDPWSADGTHRRARTAHGQDATLVAGEILYVPPFVWRSVKAAGPAVLAETRWTTLNRPRLWSATGLATRVFRRG